MRRDAGSAVAYMTEKRIAVQRQFGQGHAVDLQRRKPPSVLGLWGTGAMLTLGVPGSGTTA